MKTQDDPYGLITSRFASEGARSSGLPSAARTAEDVQFTLRQFFEAEVRNPNTRRAYRLGAKDFFVYLSTRHHVHAMDAITALHVGAWLDDMEHRRLSLPTIKQRLAGLRMMFGALVREQILRFNPVTVVKGPSHTVAKGKTPVRRADTAIAQRHRHVDTDRIT